MTNPNVKLSPPWAEFYQEINALFGDDPAINVSYDEEQYVVTLRVEDQNKADALEALLPKERTFGNVTVRVHVIPANCGQSSRLSLFHRAFEGNPAFAHAISVPSSGAAFGAEYILFRKKVVQYFMDDLSDPNGVRSTLYQDIAADVFGADPGVFFSTEYEEEEA